MAGSITGLGVTIDGVRYMRNPPKFLRGAIMKFKYLPAILVLMLLYVANPAAALMSSTNYTISTIVISGGGGPMTSANYLMNGTIGQPSPLIDPALPPQSTNYDLLTGFWYTIGAGSGCLYDYNDDGDVDGADLEEFLNAYSSSEVAGLALEFGRVDCLP